MPRVSVVVETPVSRSSRARQLEAMFDVPASSRSRMEWDVDVPLDEQPWNLGLITGPSGCGKTTIARELFGAAQLQPTLKWDAPSVIDDFSKKFTMEQVSGVCQAVGFNTMPAWLRPYAVLSNGEKFRVELARRLLEGGDLVVFDEFTSFVDRQVAKIGARAVQKHVRKSGKQFVAVACHYDIIDWLQPDWTLDPSQAAGAQFVWRKPPPGGKFCRPAVNVTISPVPRTVWTMFSPFHYLTRKVNKNCAMFGAFVDDRLAAIAAMRRAPHPRVHDIIACDRLVTLPDFQGLGLAFILIEAVGALYKAVGCRVHTYPAHPALIRSFDRSPTWALRQRPGQKRSTVRKNKSGDWEAKSGEIRVQSKQGMRPNAVFSYEGAAAEKREAVRVLSYFAKPDGSI